MRFISVFLSCLICIPLFACGNQDSTMSFSANTPLITDTMKLKIKVGTNTFTATLYDNATVAAFKLKLPLSIQMTELNGNEKYFDLPDNLPANASDPGTIRTGDLKLYGSNTLVLFYKEFSTTYFYTPLAHTDDASALAAALGSGNVVVTLALQ